MAWTNDMEAQARPGGTIVSLDRGSEARQRPAPDDAAEIDLGETIRAAFAALLRQWMLLASVVALFVAFGLVHVLTATPTFTATASIIIDPRTGSSGGAAASGLLINDALVVDSEVRVLKSRELATRLIDRLGLLDGEIARPDPGMIATIGINLRQAFESLFADSAPQEIEQDEEVIRERLRESLRKRVLRGLNVERSGETYVIDISYTSPNPGFSARVANALVEEYFLSQAETAFENTRRVNEWLGERVDVLAQAVVTADEAVEAFRRQNDLFAVRGEQLAGDVERQSANDELIRLRGEITDVSATLSSLQEAISAERIEVALAGDVATPALSGLRESFAELTERELDFRSRLGPNHELVRRAQDDLARTRRLILDEFRTIETSLAGRIETLQRRADETALRLSGLEDLTADNAVRLITLRELEREADSQRKLYETMLSRLNETTQEESFQVSSARVIARAVPPDRKSSPRSKLILALSALGGAVFAAGIAFLRESLDNVFRRPDDIQALGLPFIGVAPLHADDRRMTRKAHGRVAGKSSNSRGLTRNGVGLRFAADNPDSMTAETIRTLAAMLGRGGTREGTGAEGSVIAFTSTLKGEGKTVLSGNFAVAQAARGFRVAMVDLDLRNPALGRALTQLPAANLLEELLEDPSRIAEIEPNEALASATLIGNRGREGQLNITDPHVLDSIQLLIEKLQARYSYVVLDLPPLSGLIDARVSAQLADHVALCVEWGRTRQSRVEAVLNSNEGLRRNLTGVVYTKVPLGPYGSYNGSVAKEYYGY